MLRNFRNIIHCTFQSGQIVFYKSFYTLNRTFFVTSRQFNFLDFDIEKIIKKNMFVVLRPINHYVKESLCNICVIKALVCHSEAVKENVAVAI